MGKSNRRRFTADFKAKVALEALKEQKTLSELSAEFGVHSNQIRQWKAEFTSNAASVFEKGKAQLSDEARSTIEQPLFEHIGRLQVENDFLKKASNYLSGRK